MSIKLNATHDPARRSWLESANQDGCDFPIQNLPFGLFMTEGSAPRGGVALGDKIIDLSNLADRMGAAAHAAAGATLTPLISRPPAALSHLRAALSDLYRSDGADRAVAETALVPMEAADLLASGTVSGPAEDAKACMAEYNQRGTNPVLFADGGKRNWLEDGDSVTITATAYAEGHVPIGFGPCTGTIHAAVAA